MNVLVIAPHPDDESIGCGGALCLHAARRDPMAVVYLSSGELGLKHLPRNKAWLTREREAERAARILGVAKRFKSPELVMWGLLIGFLLGYATDLLVTFAGA